MEGGGGRGSVLGVSKNKRSHTWKEQKEEEEIKRMKSLCSRSIME